MDDSNKTKHTSSEGNSCSKPKEGEIEARKRLIVRLCRSDLSTGLTCPISEDELDSDDLDSSNANKRPRSSDDEMLSEESTKSSKISTSRRGRGRPPAMSKQVGVGKARVEYAPASREELEAARREYLERSAQEDLKRLQATTAPVPRQPRPAPELRKEAEECTTVELNTQLQGALTKIQHVSQISKGLKGTCVRDLKEAISTIREVGEALLKRTPAQEVSLLKRENARLTSQIDELRLEVADLRKELREERQKASVSNEVEPKEPVEAMVTRIMADMEARLTARFASLEGIRLRPPLSSEKQTYAAATKSQRVEASHGKASAAQTTKKAATGTSKQSHKEHKKSPTIAPRTTAAPASEWQTVGTKKKPKNKKKKAKKNRKARELRVPKSSAVVITLQPAAARRGIDYAQILRKARDCIDLSTIGVEGMSLKQARTGARLLELPGAASGEKADALAAKLRDTFPEEVIKVSRPIKRADVRISGLDDSVDMAEVATAMARVGECSAEQLKVGPIRRRNSGTGSGTSVVSCPVNVAQKLIDGRRVQVGWVTVKVKLLPSRPSRCYKCLAEGHLGVQCSSSVDCSGKCFRCGQPGHLAGNCEAPPHCIICAAANKRSDHRVGSKACLPTKQKSKATAPTAAPQTNTASAVRVEGVEMES